MSFSFQFLGTGTSVGVPMIGCSCQVCSSPDSRDRRSRSAVFVRAGGASFAIDTPPEFRLQCLELRIGSLDAVLLTHAHMDHIAGFDDVRRFNTVNGGRPIPVFAATETIAAMRRTFPYVSAEANPQGLFRPMIEYRGAEKPFYIGEAKITALPVVHGTIRTNGYLVEAQDRRFAYISDCHEIPAATAELIRGVDALAIDCLRRRPHPTHMSLEESLAIIDRVGAKRGFLTHLCHDMLHASLERELPPSVRPAYDGLTVNL